LTKIARQNWDKKRLKDRYGKDFVYEMDETFTTEILADTLKNGIAFHNSDLLVEERILVERLFRQGKIRDQYLRYGVQVQTAAGKTHDNVMLIDWEVPENNDFALAEEVTLRGGYERRPDLVLYINGIARESAWWEMSENGGSTQTKGAKKDGK